MNEEVRKKIISFLNEKSGKKATLDKFKAIIKSKDLNETLLKMIQKGEIVLAGKWYKLNNEEPLQGKVQINKMGIKFVQVNEKKMVPINSNSCYYVLEGDTVNYHIINNEAYILNIVKRDLNTRPFEVIIRNGKKCLEYTNGNFYFNSKNIDLSEYAEGEILLVDISESRIIRRISNRSNPNNRDIIIAYNHGFDDYYSNKYFEEMDAMKKEVTEEDIIGREDFRNDTVYTIDCKNTGDMDDAISVKKLANGNYQIAGHIASISEYVTFMGEIFKTAMKRGTSAYSQRSVFPMYHPIISNGICSLNPGVDRLTKSIVLEIDKLGNIVNRKLCFSVINSKKKMEYAEVDKVYADASDMDPSYIPFVEDLKLFKEVTDIMGRHLLSRGKIELANRDMKVEFDETNTANNLTGLDGPVSRKSIEYAMIYLNWQWAIIMNKANYPLMYRNHLEKDSLEKTIMKLKTAGFNTTVLERTGSFQAFLKTVENNPMEYLIASETILSSGFNRAIFGNNNMGHWALGLPIYAFFSSGIRRGADTFDHYSTDAYLTNNEKLRNELEEYSYDLPEWLNTREREGELFEEESLQYDLMEIAKKNIGYEFLGIIISIRNNKAYVKLDNSLYGIIDDAYNMCVGDRINVRITSINENAKEINLEYLGTLKSKKNKVKVRKR